MSGRLHRLAIVSATFASAGCQFLFNQASGGSPTEVAKTGTGESVEGRVRLAGADEKPAAMPLDATQPLEHKRPLLVGDDFGGIPAAAPIALTSSPALTQGSGLTLLEPYRLGRRVSATEGAVFVEAVSLVSAELLGRVAADETGHFKIGLPANSRFSPVVLQATTLQDDAITLFLAAILPPDPRGAKARTQDISPGSTAAAFTLAKLGGVGEQLDVSAGFRGFRSGGVAALGMLAETADAAGAPAIDRGVGAGISQLTLLEPYRVASGQGAAKGITAAFYTASVLGVKLAGAVHKQLNQIKGSQYRIASISLAEMAACSKLIQAKLGEPPAGAFNLGEFKISAASDLGSWALDAASKVDGTELAAEAGRKEALAQERLLAARSEGAGEDLGNQLGGVLDTVKSATVAPPSPSASPAPTATPTATPTTAPTPTPTPGPTADLTTAVNQLAKLPDGRLVAGTLDAGMVLAFDLTSGVATRGTVIAGQRSDPSLVYEDIAALTAWLPNPNGVAVASDGTIYEADTAANVIRKIDAAGKIKTIAGTGVAGSTGDGGKGTFAKLDAPTSLAISASGDLYIAEYAGNRVRKLDGAGNISTFAGGGTTSFPNPAAEGADATAVRLDAASQLAFSPAGELHLSNNSAFGVVWKIDGQGKVHTIAGRHGQAGSDGEDMPALGAKLTNPQSITFDAAGNLYISCFEGIRRVDSNGKVKTLATPTAGIGYFGILADGASFYAVIRTQGQTPSIEVRRMIGILP